MLRQIQDKFGNVTKLQTAAKARIVGLPSLGTWSYQTSNLNLAVMLIDRLHAGPGLEALYEELFSFMVKNCVSNMSQEEWSNRLRTVLGQTNTYSLTGAIKDNGNLYQSADLF